MEILTEPIIESHKDYILPMSALGERWLCHPRVALRRAKAQGVPLIRWNQRVISVRFSDVLAAERAAAEHPEGEVS
jgi:hypothetical protein